jgi:hypothetical protein
MRVIAAIQETEGIRRVPAHPVKIAGGGAPLRRPAIAARLRPYFTQLTRNAVP